jgi:hypothetical protein
LPRRLLPLNRELEAIPDEAERSYVDALMPPEQPTLRRLAMKKLADWRQPASWDCAGAERPCGRGGGGDRHPRGLRIRPVEAVQAWLQAVAGAAAIAVEITDRLAARSLPGAKIRRTGALTEARRHVPGDNGQERAAG